jgi:hypothetical protein
MSFSASSSYSEVLSAFVWATAGGIAVFAGLVLEKMSDWLNDRFVGGYKPHKWIEEIGWWVLMVGIVIETAVAGNSAIEQWKNDPLKNPIADASATVRFLVAVSSYEKPFFKTDTDDIVGWRSSIIFFEGTNSTDTVLQLMASQNDLVVFRAGLPPKLRCQLQFHADPLMDFVNVDGKQNFPAEKLNNVASFVLSIPQIETNAEILSGSVVLVANGKTWTFDIPPQRQKWGLITSEKIINANNKMETKVMRIQIGDLTSPPRWTNRWYDGK